MTGQGQGHVRVGSDALVSRVAEVLGEHAIKAGVRDRRAHCWCGWSSGTETHTQHLATVLADLVHSERAAAAVEAQADAWDEGKNAGAADTAQIIGWGVRGAPIDEEPPETPNPYRSTNTTPTKETNHG